MTKNKDTAIQILFKPRSANPYVSQIPIHYEFHPGFHKSNHQKNVQSIHKSACQLTRCERPLEISSASENEFGRALSAFNLQVTLNCNGSKITRTVEQWYQSSKVYEHGAAVCFDAPSWPKPTSCGAHNLNPAPASLPSEWNANVVAPLMSNVGGSACG